MDFILFFGNIFLFDIRRQLDGTLTPESAFCEGGSSLSLSSSFSLPAGVFCRALWPFPYTCTAEGSAKDSSSVYMQILGFPFCGFQLLLKCSPEPQGLTPLARVAAFSACFWSFPSAFQKTVFPEFTTAICKGLLWYKLAHDFWMRTTFSHVVFHFHFPNK